LNKIVEAGNNVGRPRSRVGVSQVDSDDVGALRQADGVAPALPGDGTSDESDVALDATCHIVSLLMSGCQFFTQDLQRLKG
jgi:hypothetical protein